MVNKRIYTSYNKTRQILSYHMIYDIYDSNGVHVRISQGTPLYGNTEGFIFVL